MDENILEQMKATALIHSEQAADFVNELGRGYLVEAFSNGRASAESEANAEAVAICDAMEVVHQRTVMHQTNMLALMFLAAVQVDTLVLDLDKFTETSERYELVTTYNGRLIEYTLKEKDHG